jgi:F-type H+-transporting ATPase subunit b
VQINWFTFAAQIVNFLILIWLLKRFLYGPIVSAMDRREEKIRQRLESAEEKEREARRKSEALAAEREAFDEQREQLLAEAREEIDRQKKEWMAEARAEVERQERRWREAVHQQQSSFLEELRDRAAGQLVHAAERIVGDLAGESLGQQVLETFIHRLETLDEERLAAMQGAISSGEESELLVSSSFEVPDPARDRLREVLRDHLNADVQLHYRPTSAMVLGIEVRVGGWKLAWSLDSYLASVEEDLREVFEAEPQRSIGSDDQSREVESSTTA